MIVENNNCLKNQQKCHFLKPKWQKVLKENTFSIISLKEHLECPVCLDLPKSTPIYKCQSKWSHCLQHLSWKGFQYIYLSMIDLINQCIPLAMLFSQSKQRCHVFEVIATYCQQKTFQSRQHLAKTW